MYSQPTLMDSGLILYHADCIHTTALVSHALASTKLASNVMVLYLSDYKNHFLVKIILL